MFKQIKALQTEPNRLLTATRMNSRSWLRQAGFYAILTIAIAITGCDSAGVDGMTSEPSAVKSDIQELANANGDPGELAPVCEAVLVDLALVIDVSDTMFGPPLQAAKDGAKALVAELTDSEQGALVSFATEAQRDLDLTVMDAAGQGTLNSAIDGLTALGGTNTQGGIIYGAEELTGEEDLYDFVTTSPSGNDRTDAEKIMIILSDGLPNRYYDDAGNVITDFSATSQTEAENAATTAKGEGIRIFTIAIGDADEAAMEALASSPDDAFTNENVDELVEVFLDIAEAICPTPVDIDIKPASDPNSINPNNKGNIPVAVFTSDAFDATTIDPETVRFGSLSLITSGQGAELAHTDGHLEDVDGDGRPDFVGHFPTQDTGFTSADEEGWIIGETTAGESFAGRDDVRIVDRGKPTP